MNNDTDNEHFLGSEISRLSKNINPDRMLLKRALAASRETGTRSPFQFVRSSISVWKIALPTVLVIVFVVLGTWHGRQTLYLLSQRLTASPFQTQTTAPAGYLPPATPIPETALSSGSSDSDLTHDMTVIKTATANASANSAATDDVVHQSPQTL